jgi:hypothetical protein
VLWASARKWTYIAEEQASFLATTAVVLQALLHHRVMLSSNEFTIFE